MELSHSIERGYLRVDEVSRYLGVKRSTIYEWVKEGKIPYYNLGKMKRFKQEEIDVWMESNREDDNLIDKKVKRVLEISKGQKKSSRQDIDGVVRKAIEEVREGIYDDNNGNQTKVKGLRKGVKNGNL